MAERSDLERLLLTFTQGHLIDIRSLIIELEPAFADVCELPRGKAIVGLRTVLLERLEGDSDLIAKIPILRRGLQRLRSARDGLEGEGSSGNPGAEGNGDSNRQVVSEAVSQNPNLIRNNEGLDNVNEGIVEQVQNTNRNAARGDNVNEGNDQFRAHSTLRASTGGQSQINEQYLSQMISQAARVACREMQQSRNGSFESSAVRQQYNSFMKECSTRKISFDGNGSIVKFLKKITDSWEDYNFADRNKIRALGDLLHGKALTFYEGHEDDWGSWTQCKRALLAAFHSEESEEEVIDKMKTTRMSEQQSLTDYIHEIRATNKQLSDPLSSDTLLRIIKKNMSWKYHSLLGTSVNIFLSLGELEAAARRADVTVEREKDRQQKQASFKNFKASEAEIDLEVDAMDDRFLVCHNCKEMGHRYVNCGKPKRVTCRKCGMTGFVESNCPKCSVTQEKLLDQEQLIKRITEAVLKQLQAENRPA